MKKSIKYEMFTMLNMRGFCFSFLIMLVFSIYSFAVVAFRLMGVDRSSVFSADACFMGCYYSPTWYFFLYIFSFVIVLPHATSYIADIETGVYSLAVLRSGKKNYFLSKMIATFVGNFIMIAIPFLINLILCHMTFSSTSNYPFGEYGLPNYYRTVLGSNYIFSTDQTEIPFMHIFLTSPTLYNLLYIFIVSVVSGYLGVFVLSLSFLFNRNRAYLFAPIYIFMLASSVVTEYRYSRAVSNPSIQFVNYNLMDYIAVFGYPGKSLLYISVVITVCTSFVVVATIHAIKADQLLVVSYEKT